MQATHGAAGSRQLPGSQSVPAAVSLSVRDVSKRFGATQALSDVSLDVARGSIHALLGANGSGKSTLIKVLAGVGRADSGTFEVNGITHSADATSPEWAHSAGLRFVHQSVGVFADMTVAENMVLGPGSHSSSIAPVRRKRLVRQVQEDLERFDIHVDPNRLLGDLSSVEQAMVAVARAFRNVSSDGILVLDEPTASMPQDEVDLLLRAMRKWADRGHAIVIVSHRLQEIHACADMATFLRDGKVLDTVAVRDLDHDGMVHRIAGRSLAVEPNSAPVSARAAQPERVKISELTTGALSDLSLTVGKGEILGISSLVGSASSQIFDALFGVRRSVKGSIHFDGDEYRPRSTSQAVRAGVAYVPSDRRRDAGFMDLSLRENLWAVEPSLRGNGLRVDLRRERLDAESVLARYNVVSASPEALLSSLSGGNQQKVVISRWLERQPRLLLLDEPTQGVDVGARGAIHRLLHDAAERGTSCIVASSDPQELVDLCDRVVGFVDGRVRGEIRGADLSVENCLALAHQAPTSSQPHRVENAS